MKHFNFKNRNLFSGPHLLGITLIFSGLFVVMSPYFMVIGSSMAKILGIGVGAIIIGILIVTSYSGSIIDITKGRFKEYTSIAGYKFGEWSTLPEISKITLISTSYTATNTPNGISPTLSGKVTDFKTLLYSDSAKPILSFTYTSKVKASRDAKSLATQFNCDLEIKIQE